MEDLTGKRFGRWTVVGFGGIKITEYKRKNQKRIDSVRMWLCECSCDKHTIKEVRENTLLKGQSKSCGCLARELSSKRKKNIPNNFRKGLPNQIEIIGNAIAIFDSKGNKSIIDKEEYDKIKMFRWRKSTHDWSAFVTLKQRSESLSPFYKEEGGSSYRIVLHRFIMNISDSQQIVDHIDGDINNNCKSNLRIVEKKENNLNKTLRNDSSTKSIGVSFSKKGHYHAYINKDGIRYNLGCFETLEEGAYARYIAEIKLFKEFSIYPSRHILPPNKPLNYKEIENKVNEIIERKQTL